MQNILHIFFTRQDMILLLNYLDSDKSGDIDLREFLSKISFNNMHIKSHKYLLTEHRFIEAILTIWYEYRAA